MTVPILRNHNTSDVIGYVDADKTTLKVMLNDPLSREEIFEIFGTIGMQARVGGDKDKITQFTILEWSKNVVPTVSFKDDKITLLDRVLKWFKTKGEL